MKLTRHLVLALAASLAIAVGLWRLAGAEAGLAVRRVEVRVTPVTVFRPAAGAAAPVVVIAHGFAGSQQLMQPFATTLARNGYVAVTFDFLGHGRHPSPLRGSPTDGDGVTEALVGQLGEVVAFARGLGASDGRLALLGHSMASDIVVRYAKTHPDVAATVAVSMFAPGVTAASPRNLLVIAGGLEPAALKDAGLRAVATASGEEPPQEGVTYGRFADGTARRVAFSAGVEHIGVLYSRRSMAEALAWLNAAFGRTSAGLPDMRGSWLDARGPWIGLLVLGVVVLARPFSRLLPRAADRPLGAGLRWRRLLPVAVAPALLTPLILSRLPTDFLPILLGDYLAAHFALYGLLTAAGLWIATRRDASPPGATVAPGGLAVGAAAAALYGVLAFGLPIDRFVTSFMPVPGRVPLVLAMLVGTLPYFAADEWLTRGRAAPRGAYAATSLCFVLSLAVAIALDPGRLFFLIIVVPVIVLLFGVYGLLSTWAYRRTRHPLVGAFANAAAFAWAIAVTLPLVDRS